MMSEISLIKRLNNRGPITLPCGVPLLIVHGYESDEPTRTCHFSLKRNTRYRVKDFHVCQTQRAYGRVSSGIQNQNYCSLEINVATGYAWVKK